MTFERLIVRMGYAVLVGVLFGIGLHVPPMLLFAAIAVFMWHDAYRRGEA